MYDGHCGRAAADEARVLLAEELDARLPGAANDLASGAGVQRVWEAAFLATDAAIRSEDGCTATALLAWTDASGAVCLQVT